MATPTEKWKSSGLLTEQNIFLKQRKHFGNRPVLFEDGTPTSLQHLRAIQLQQELQQLQERERKAQRRNRQLLQQFEQAQSALDEMLACNTSMKAIRMEYERYLEVSAPRWLQQFKEKTKAVQKERMEKHLTSHQEEAKCPVPNLTAEDRFLSQVLLVNQSQSSKSPPTIPHSFLVHPFASSPLPPWPRKDSAVWASPQHRHPWLAGTSQPESRGFQNGENSKRRGGSRSGHLSQELDIKPVRLSSRHSESNGSSRGPTLSTKGRRKKRGRVELSSSDINSEESSRTSDAPVTESKLQEDPSSDKGSFRKTQRSESLTSASPRSDKKAAERTEKKSERQNEENQRSEEESGSSSERSMQEKEGRRSHGDESESCRREELEKEETQGSDSCEQRNTEEEIQTHPNGREEEKRLKSQKDRRVEDDEDSSRKTTTEEEDGEEEAGTAAEEDLDEEPPNKLDNEKIQDSSSSQDEDEEEMENSEKKNKKESKSDEEGETDSDDSIISPQNKRYKENLARVDHVTTTEEHAPQSSAQTALETASEDEDDEDEDTGSSNENARESSDENDVENVLAPQDRNQKDASHVFVVTEDRRKAERRDSDDFDPFYD